MPLYYREFQIPDPVGQGLRLRIITHLKRSLIRWPTIFVSNAKEAVNAPLGGDKRFNSYNYHQPPRLSRVLVSPGCNLRIGIIAHVKFTIIIDPQ